jgi:hypothetical protein
VALCREIGLLTRALAAVDGSIQGRHHARQDLHANELKKGIEHVAEHIAGYLQAPDTADRPEGDAVEARRRS